MEGKSLNWQNEQDNLTLLGTSVIKVQENYSMS